MLRFIATIGCLLLTGCSMLPEAVNQPQLHNPFPQLAKVAVAPFFNLSEEPTLNGKDVALAYFNELQSIRGFEVVPVGVVETHMRRNGLTLNSPDDARRLAQSLGVDAVLVGAVTDYTPYYPPRLALQVEWYSANPGFHPIPPGYGLPWGTPEEDQIPAPLVFEAEFALAKEQLKTQTPSYEPLPMPAQAAAAPQPTPSEDRPAPKNPWRDGMADEGIEPLAYQAPVEMPAGQPPNGGLSPAEAMATMGDQCIPPGWPDPRGFIPPPPKCHPPTCWPNDAPVIRHTKTYNGNDMWFTEALSTYYTLRDEARFGGWQSYLQRTDDFVRFCCHLHLAETISARGGAEETRVVWRWPKIR